jgi:hypothetical protein
MQLLIRGTQHEVYAMAEWLPSLFAVVGPVHISTEQDLRTEQDLYRLDANVHCVPQSTP